MPPAGEASSSSGHVSVIDAVRNALSNVDEFVPKADENKLMALKEEAAQLRKKRKENAKAQKNERRKKARILAKGSGWEENDILECFRLKHENTLRRQRMKQEREEKRSKTEILTVASEIANAPTEGEEPVS